MSDFIQLELRHWETGLVLCQPFDVTNVVESDEHYSMRIAEPPREFMDAARGHWWMDWYLTVRAEGARWKSFRGWVKEWQPEEQGIMVLIEKVHESVGPSWYGRILRALRIERAVAA